MSIIVNMHEAKTHLSRLVEQAANGREFVIAKAGKPMVRVIPIEPVPTARALGFLAGQGVVSLDVKTGFAAEIDNMFGAAEG
jgi:prevent-host-death family protein